MPFFKSKKQVRDVNTSELERKLVLVSVSMIFNDSAVVAFRVIQNVKNALDN